ncbi:hypothetical protein BDW59DRAFT_155251 [Aspergillus cavernicola]|uniref:Protein kinase domain-containing protein n=1 Tax=Aspergillus cavernicola TaxID=176166 RepID=A0ABR4HB56_9EURO
MGCSGRSFRVIYPLCDEFPFFQHFSADQFSAKIKIALGVFQILDISSKTPYVLKVVNRPFYEPHETEVICQELKNLQTFRGVPNIVQAVGIAVSTNLYTTLNTKGQPLVLIGIVLEFCSGGSLEKVLSEHCLLQHF